MVAPTDCNWDGVVVQGGNYACFSCEALILDAVKYKDSK